jgi:F-type H+-transporting ATPase subunit delta
VSGEDPIIAGVAGRYATALFDLASESNKLAPVEKDLNRFQQMLDSSEDLRRLVENPVFSAEDQSRALAAILKHAGIKGICANFLGLVSANRRLFAVRDIVRAFRALTARHRGEVTAQVTTATALTPAQTKSLAAVLKSSIGRDVQIETKLDPSLLGGLVVKVGSRMVDNSLKTKLDNLKLAMKEVG